MAFHRCYTKALFTTLLPCCTHQCDSTIASNILTDAAKTIGDNLHHYQVPWSDTLRSVFQLAFQVPHRHQNRLPPCYSTQEKSQCATGSFFFFFPFQKCSYWEQNAVMWSASFQKQISCYKEQSKKNSGKKQNKSCFTLLGLHWYEWGGKNGVI